MLRLAPCVAVVLLVVLGAVGCSVGGPQIDESRMICDGEWPKWVLDAQGYQRGGCVHPIPFDQAPKGADWTPICTGMCLCDDGQLLLGEADDLTCTTIPANQPWPSDAWYTPD